MKPELAELPVLATLSRRRFISSLSSKPEPDDTPLPSWLCAVHACNEVRTPLSSLASPNSRLSTHLVDDKVLSFAPQVVGQVAVLAELHDHHQRACRDNTKAYKCTQP